MYAQLWEEEDSVQLYPGLTHGSSDTIGRGRRGKAPCLAVLVAQNAWLRQNLHHAIPSTSEGRFSMNVDELLGTMVVNMFFIALVFHEMYKKIRTLSAQTQSIKKLEFR